MHVLVEGSGGRSGWPQPGCRCASCLRCQADGNIRNRSTIVVDGVLRLGGEIAGNADGYRVQAIAGGWDVTSADGERLFYAAGAVADPPQGAAPYDVAFLDMLGDPAQLGRLRARGLVRADTITVVAFADHRVPTAAELQRRGRLWRVSVPADGDAITTDRSAHGWKEAHAGVRRAPWRVLVMGGARSGKSERAELRLAGEPDVTYLATGARPGGTGDPDWAARVAAHRARRPGWWRTAETTDLAAVLGSARGAVLIDGIGTWLAAVLDECGGWDGAGGADWADGVNGVGGKVGDRVAELAGGPGGVGLRGGGAMVGDRVAELVAAWRQTEAYVVAVSDETGMGVVPATAAGRLFRDELGRLNQALAAESEETELVIAGRVVPLGTL
jgi:adenosylcobinamide kinase/adenosylcobinamide-phosphate guanylyltransferase